MYAIDGGITIIPSLRVFVSGQYASGVGVAFALTDAPAPYSALVNC